MDNLHRMQMPQSRADLLQRPFPVQCARQRQVSIWRLDQICQTTLTQVERNVQKVVAPFLAVIPDDIWVIVGSLQELDFLRCEARKVGQEAFDGYCARAPCAFENDGAVRSEAYSSVPF